MARRILAREGCESGVGGHVSLRALGEDAFWVSPFEYFDESLPDRIIKTSFDLQRLEGDWEPSPAVAFHADFYRARPDVNCVIHTHSHYAMVLATTGRELAMYNDMSALFLDEQVIYVEDGVKPIVDGSAMAAQLGKKHVLMIKNHGPIFLGNSLETTTVSAFVFEHAARIQVEAEMIGGSEHAREYAVMAKPIYSQYFLPQTWAASVRRLQREPELFAYGLEPVTA